MTYLRKLRYIVTPSLTFFCKLNLVYFGAENQGTPVYFQTIRRRCGDAAVDSRARQNHPRSVPGQTDGIRRDIRASHPTLALLRRFHELRRTRRLDGAVVLRSDVLHADQARIPAERLRYPPRQALDEGGAGQRIPAVRGDPAGERRLQGAVRQAGVQETLRDGQGDPFTVGREPRRGDARSVGRFTRLNDRSL